MQCFIPRKPTRLKDFDYSTPGYYFVTICTENRELLFGAIKNNQMILNDIGNMVDLWWHKIFETYKNALVDEYIIMPNHIHGLINIVGAGPCTRPLSKNNEIYQRKNVNGNDDDAGENMVSPLQTGLGQCLAWFKRMTTNKYIHNVKNNNWPPFNKRLWQRNYHDHIVRNDQSLKNIREYIINNPKNWGTDENNIKNYSTEGGGRNPYCGTSSLSLQSHVVPPTGLDMVK